MQLPFADGTFDAVVASSASCSSPTSRRRFRRHVACSGTGGVFIFNVWDRIEENEFADTVTTALESVFPEDPPRFLARTPHGYYDRPAIERDLANGGFTASPEFARSRRAVGQNRRGSQRSRTARGRRYGTRSRRATLRGSAKQPIMRRKRSPSGSGEGLWTARSRHTSSPLKLNRRNLARSACLMVAAGRCRRPGSWKRVELLLSQIPVDELNTLDGRCRSGTLDCPRRDRRRIQATFIAGSVGLRGASAGSANDRAPSQFRRNRLTIYLPPRSRPLHYS